MSPSLHSSARRALQGGIAAVACALHAPGLPRAAFSPPPAATTPACSRFLRAGALVQADVSEPLAPIGHQRHQAGEDAHERLRRRPCQGRTLLHQARRLQPCTPRSLSISGAGHAARWDVLGATCQVCRWFCQSGWSPSERVAAARRRGGQQQAVQVRGYEAGAVRHVQQRQALQRVQQRVLRGGKCGHAGVRRLRVGWGRSPSTAAAAAAQLPNNRPTTVVAAGI
jgi:hypothetical protein